jgi:DNA-binding Lrp family transcriptional regulator
MYMLQPRDLFVALALHVLPDPAKSFENLEADIGLSASTLHRSVHRLTAAGLLTRDRLVRRANLTELIVFGVRYVYYVELGGPTRGVPTAHAAPPLNRTINQTQTVPVWPDPEGTTRGYAVAPLDKVVPKAARRNPRLHELLALVDAIRIGQSRERNLAVEHLRKRLEATDPVGAGTP